ncbi:MAG: peroxiredoxin [Burkholderiaceae bacterium]|jgi:peroxiredoxin|nr:MAG: peroxiredoxin [Burkholderiaceae bacterium]
MNTADSLRPTDDGQVARLMGLALPAVALPATDGRSVDLSRLPGWRVIYVYTWTGRPGLALPDDWDAIPGAHGSTPQSEAFRDHYDEFEALGAGMFGLSAQPSDFQREARDRLGLPFELLSDSEFRLKHLLRLPTFFAGPREFYKRLTLVARDGRIEKAFYPVLSPERNADEVLAWLRAAGRTGAR